MPVAVTAGPRRLCKRVSRGRGGCVRAAHSDAVSGLCRDVSPISVGHVIQMPCHTIMWRHALLTGMTKGRDEHAP